MNDADYLMLSRCWLAWSIVHVIVYQFTHWRGEAVMFGVCLCVSAIFRHASKTGPDTTLAEARAQERKP